MPHYWIELSKTFCAYLEHPQEELVIDSNLRKRLFEDEKVPHGVFAKNREQDMNYVGRYRVRLRPGLLGSEFNDRWSTFPEAD
ncbi:hypothetical protein HMPREF1487_09061 [Pseudomonas sp. HPB0071]|nr:hypothetical protein HMPREF1487_09061 [Pseudomonas sp. HPB0071]